MKTLTAMMATLALTACGMNEDSQLNAMTDASEFSGGQFQLSTTVNDTMDNCDVYTELNLTSSATESANVKATLNNVRYNAPNAFCPAVAILLDKRDYENMQVESSGCGSVFITGTNANGDEIHIADHRKLICRMAVPAQIVVTETRNGAKTKLYKFANAPDLTPPPIENKQKTLGCVETSTFVDGPGSEYRIAISKDGVNSFILSHPVRMRGTDEQPWSVEAPLAKVEDRGESMSIDQYTDPVDWSQTDSCYRFTRATTFNLTKNAGGEYSGEVTQGGYVSVDPSVPNCSFPHMMPARPKKVVCHLY